MQLLNNFPNQSRFSNSIKDNSQILLLITKHGFNISNQQENLNMANLTWQKDCSCQKNHVLIMRQYSRTKFTVERLIYDNAPSHTSERRKQFWKTKKVTGMPYQPCFSDLAQCDVSLLSMNSSNLVVKTNPDNCKCSTQPPDSA